MLGGFMRRKWSVLSIFLFITGLFFLPGALSAQTFRGSINGTITDSSGAFIPGAKVTAVDTATSAARETISSGAGEFSFSDLPLSTYTIKVEAASFQTVEVTGVQVEAGKIHTLPVKLSIAQQATTVEVAADALSLDTTSVTQTTTLEGKSLQNTPLNGRDFTQLLGTSVAFAGYNNSGSVNGTRNNQVNYTINGTDNNDLYLNVDAVNQGGISGIAGVVYPIDALDEYSLQTTGNSETGRSPGGNLNVTTKSGTNQFHGDAYYYNRNEALAVTSPFHVPGSRVAAAAQRELWRFDRRAHLAQPHLPLPPLRGAEVRHRRSQYRHRALASLPGAGARGVDQIRRRAQPGLAEHPQHDVGSERHCQSSRSTLQLLQQRAAERL